MNGHTLDRDMGMGENHARPIIPVMLIMAVPIGAVGVLSGERVHGSRLGWIQDAGWRRVIKHDAIHVLVQLGHLQLEILDGEVDAGTPRLELCSRRSERILQRLENFIFGEF